jgi:hypothetical protein
MDLSLEWHSPLPLSAERHNAIYWLDLDKVPQTLGIYVFYREFGSKQSALYVGKALDLKVRVGQQLNNVKLMMALRNATNGRRQIVFGELTRGGKGIDAKLKLIERTLIRYYQQASGELVNVHGNRIVHHSLTSERSMLRDFIPHRIFFEK